MSNGWSSPPTAFVDEALERLKAVHTVVFDEVHKSFKDGSEITGAKGQPVDQFELRPSILQERISEFVSQSATNKAYAPGIEDGINYGNIAQGYLPEGPMTLRSAVGQFHNREATIQGFGKIVDYANAVTP